MREEEVILNYQLNFENILHIGACRGTEISFYRNLLLANNVVFVEPNPDVYKELLINIEKDKKGINVYTYQLACSNKVEKNVDFNIIYGSDANFMEGNKGCSSFLEIDYDNVVKANNSHHFIFKEKIKVDTITIDKLIEKHPDIDFNFLNIDAQGVEYQILDGARELLKKQSLEMILVEATVDEPFYINNCSFDSVKNLLSQYGYIFDRMIWHSIDKWGDAIFIKE